MATSTIQSISEAIRKLDSRQLVRLLHSSTTKTDISVLQNVDVFHQLVNALDDNKEETVEATKIVYILSLHRADINLLDQDGDIALLGYLRTMYVVSDDVIQAFLRCGADVTLKNKNGLDVLGYILKADHLPRNIKARVLEYMPGIWGAVDSDDAMTVRRLINQWCAIRTVKNGMSVVDLAYSKGTENIIRVITGIGTHMDLAHAVLGGDLPMVKHILQSKFKVNINLKNMSELGATPLYYAMCQNNRPMVELLLKHGASVTTGMQGDDQMEIPLFFVAISTKPTISTEILQHTIPTSPVAVDQLFYKGRNVLFYCLDHSVATVVFDKILRHSSASVLTQRLQGNVNARDYACIKECNEYIEIIDKVVIEWCSNVENPANRNLLALHGYPITDTIALPRADKSQTQSLAQFLAALPEYDEFKTKLLRAVEDGDVISVKDLLYCQSWSERGLDTFFADSRVIGDGQPLLQKAVLRQHVDMVRVLAEFIFHKCHMKLDSIKDQYFRTAMHYVYGLEDGKDMIAVLEDLGMSEYSMDKDGRSPLAFKDRQGQQEMQDLLQYQLLQDFSDPEPDPWSVPRPLPIMGYMSKCVHEHHANRQRSALTTPDQYDSISRTHSGHLTAGHYNSEQYSQIGSASQHGSRYTNSDVILSNANDLIPIGEMENQNREIEIGAAGNLAYNQIEHTNFSESRLTSVPQYQIYCENADSEIMVAGAESHPRFYSESNELKKRSRKYKYGRSRSEDVEGQGVVYSQQGYHDNVYVGQGQCEDQTGESSDTYSDRSEIEENYEGDDSEPETEDEDVDADKMAYYCTIL